VRLARVQRDVARARLPQAPKGVRQKHEDKVQFLRSKFHLLVAPGGDYRPNKVCRVPTAAALSCRVPQAVALLSMATCLPLAWAASRRPRPLAHRRACCASTGSTVSHQRQLSSHTMKDLTSHTPRSTSPLTHTPHRSPSPHDHTPTAVPTPLSPLSQLDPDFPIDWEQVRAVRFVTSDPIRCPICLVEPPLAPQLYGCGHVLCLPCALRFHASCDEAGTVPRCPLCAENVSLSVRPRRLRQLSTAAFTARFTARVHSTRSQHAFTAHPAAFGHVPTP
jgi:hypothetical protein